MKNRINYLLTFIGVVGLGCFLGKNATVFGSEVGKGNSHPTPVDEPIEIISVEERLLIEGTYDTDDDNFYELLLELPYFNNTLSQISEDGLMTVDNYDLAPDLDAFTDAYTITITNKTCNMNGEVIPVRQINVKDNKGYMGLTETTHVDMVSARYKPFGKELIEYMFSYGFSALVGKLNVVGPLADFTIGAIVAVSSNDDVSIISTGGSPLLSSTCVSVTNMEYIYIYWKNQWRLVSSYATVNGSGSLDFAGNVNGNSVIKHKSGEFHISSQIPTQYMMIKNYIDRYLTLGDSYAFTEYPIGEFEIPCYNKRGVYHAPKFAKYPAYLIR